MLDFLSKTHEDENADNATMMTRQEVHTVAGHDTPLRIYEAMCIE